MDLFGKSSVLRSNWRIVSPDARGHNGSMAKRRIYDDELHVQFVTFSCYRRRRSLDHPRASSNGLARIIHLEKLDMRPAYFATIPISFFLSSGLVT